jgi:TPR repeat protein
MMRSTSDVAPPPAAFIHSPEPRAQRLPLIPMVLTGVLAAFLFMPVVRAHPTLRWTMLGASGGLLAWELLLWALASRRGRAFRSEFAAIPSHYVQACVQACIMAYWAWHASEVHAEIPLFVTQLIYLYCLEALITWSRGRVWRVGFGPVPIVLSTNLLLWFKHDYYYLQFAMLTLGALGKQFLTWNRVVDGVARRTHIFNPSAFGQFLVALALIATGLTSELTWGERIAASFDAPSMLVVIFLGGLIVQSLFHVTLVTLAAVAVIAALNLAYTQATGVYYFININISASIFLGVHLLITDPATSPRTDLGRLIFGGLYGGAYFALFRVLDNAGVPVFWDKLLPVAILNLCVPMIERLTRTGALGWFDRTWHTLMAPRWRNAGAMACWIGLFGTMLATGFIEAPHPGNSIPFWKQALAENRPHAARGYLIATGAQAEGLGVASAHNELGLIAIEGSLPGFTKNDALAARHFAKASELGDIHGSMNVAVQFLFLRGLRSEQDVARALDHLERACGTHPDANICFLVGYAYETGRGRPLDPARAVTYYERCGVMNTFAARGLARLALTPGAGRQAYDLTEVAPALIQAASAGDDECHWYLAYMYDLGQGVPRDPGRSRLHLEQACKLGLERACQAMNLPRLPPFAKPVMLVPGWSSAYPVLAAGTRAPGS